MNNPATMGHWGIGENVGSGCNCKMNKVSETGVSKTSCNGMIQKRLKSNNWDQFSWNSTSFDWCCSRVMISRLYKGNLGHKPRGSGVIAWRKNTFNLIG